MKDGTMFKINQRDILLVEFYFTDLQQKKIRPALVLSSSNFNDFCEDIILCLITSNISYESKNVLITMADLESGELLYNSMVKPHKLFALHKSLIIKKLGTLKSEKYSEVYNKILDLVSPK